MEDWWEPLRWSLSCWKVPLLVKIPYTLFIGLLVPAYWRHYGLANFLWFSDVALLTTLIALWLESPLLASMQAVSVALLELAWLVDFSGRLLAGTQLIGLAEYMFKRDIPLFVRGLSLFHVWLPFLLLWLVYRLGYDERAWVAQTLLAWVVLLLCYFLTKPSENINWAFRPGTKAQTRMAPGLYLILIMAFFPACIYFPTHLVLKATMPRQLNKGNLPLWREGEGWPPKILIERLDATGAGDASAEGSRDSRGPLTAGGRIVRQHGARDGGTQAKLPQADAVLAPLAQGKKSRCATNKARRSRVCPGLFLLAVGAGELPRPERRGQRPTSGVRGHRALWLVPWLMLAVLLTGLVRFSGSGRRRS